MFNVALWDFNVVEELCRKVVMKPKDLKNTIDAIKDLKIPHMPIVPQDREHQKQIFLLNPEEGKTKWSMIRQFSISRVLSLQTRDGQAFKH